MAMGRQVITFDPIAQPSGSFNSQLPRGCGTIRIKNDSIVDLLFSINNFASMATEVAPGATVDIEGQPPYTQIYWATQYKLTTNVKTIASKVTIIVYDPSEAPPDIASDLPRHFNPTNIGFSASDSFLSTSAANTNACCVFNPANSGVNYVFFRAEFSSNDATSSVLPEIGWFTSDPNFPIAIAFVANSIVTGSSSTTHATESTGTVAVNFAGFWQQEVYQVNTNYNFIPFPAQKQCPPGTGIGINATIAVGKIMSFTIEWTETPI